MAGEQVFEGVKIVDFTWIGVGPVTIKYFSDHGATVAHIESNTRPDGLRIGGPFRDQIPGIDRSGFFANFNSSKYGVSLNLNLPKGIEVAKRFVQWADVVAESFTPRAMAKWGLGYQDLVKIKPDIIMYSTCQQGQTGPYREYPGYGGQGAALAGFAYVTGWPDREPASPYGAYTDFINPRLGATAIAAALDYRRRTGKGMHIDLSQIEGGIQFLAPVMLDYTANGRIMERMGNRSPWAAPHGAFRCQGEDRWLAIAVETDAQWEALGRVVGEEWAKDRRFATLLGRLEHVDELERLVEAWTQDKDAYELMKEFQAAGVPAGVVQKTSDLFEDPQLAQRRHFWYLEHKEIGLHAYDAHSFRLSKTPEELRMPGPCLGEHNEYVYKEILGMSDEEVADLIIGGVLE